MSIFATVNPGPFPTLKRSQQFHTKQLLLADAWKAFKQALENTYEQFNIVRTRQRLIGLGVPARHLNYPRS